MECWWISSLVVDSEAPPMTSITRTSLSFVLALWICEFKLSKLHPALQPKENSPITSKHQYWIGLGPSAVYFRGGLPVASCAGRAVWLSHLGALHFMHFVASCAVWALHAWWLSWNAIHFQRIIRISNIFQRFPYVWMILYDLLTDGFLVFF